MNRGLKVLAVLVVAAACSDDPVPIEWGVAALTRNVYVGADIERILTASTPQELVTAVELTYQDILGTDFPERAGRLAGEIATAAPHVVGLQEISLLRTQSPGDAATGGTTPAVDTLQDYLTLLLDSLAALGANYRVAAKIENWDVELPRANGDDARLTDYDVILVKSGVTTGNAAVGNYTTNLGVPVIGAGTIVDITRGWAAVDITIDGVTVRVVNTHLESASVGIRLGQAVELTEMLSSETRPILLIGDLNTDAIAGTDPTYGQFLNEGYQDLWVAGLNLGQGLSCCHASLLDNATSTFDQRIDFVMVRNVKALVAVTGDVFGDAGADKTASGLWPSDHGGVYLSATMNQ